MFLLTRLCISAVGVLAGVALPLNALWGVLLPLLMAFLLLRGPRASFWLAMSVALMALPLLGVHAMLNPQFVRTAELGWMPWRAQGAWYALAVAERLALLFAAVSVWQGVPRLTLVGLMARSRLPTSLALTLAYSVALIEQLQSKVSQIHMSLLSRGIFDGPWLRSRIYALLAMTVPMIASSLTEALVRSDVRTGLGPVTLARLKGCAPLGRLRTTDALAAGGLLVACLIGGWCAR